MLLGCAGFVEPSKIRAKDRAGNKREQRVRGVLQANHSLISSE